jgi:hypothetical protein
MSHSHRAAANYSDKSMALVVLPAFYPVERPEDEEALGYWKEVQYQIERAYTEACKAAEAAMTALRDARFLGVNESICEQMYALAVMNAMHFQAAVDEWSYPTCWTDGKVDEDGYIRVWNDGAKEDPQMWQGDDMNEVKCDINGMGMKVPH